MSLPKSLDEVNARMREIQATLADDDGVAVFNGMYLTVTERITATTDDSSAAPNADPAIFSDQQTMSELAVRFANLWLTAHDADERGGTVPNAWRPLFESRRGGRLPIQYAIAGMNSHIEHDLPIAVVDTCQALGLSPEDMEADYEAVNAVLADVESSIRRSFLTDVGREVDDHVGPVVHLINSWNIDQARDLSWVTAQTLWALRGSSLLRGRFLKALSHSVGMTSRVLLTPTL